MAAQITRKVTYALPDSLVHRVRDAVLAGAYPSQAALVEGAVEKELRRLRDEQLDRDMLDAGSDPEFLRRTGECMVDFGDAE